MIHNMLAACSTVPGKKKESMRDILKITMKEWADVSKLNTSKKWYTELPPTRSSVEGNLCYQVGSNVFSTWIINYKDLCIGEAWLVPRHQIQVEQWIRSRDERKEEKWKKR